MNCELLAVIVGGGIGILSSLLTILVGEWRKERRTRAAISNAIIAQLKFAKNKLERFKEGRLEHSELQAGKPLFKALAENVGYLSASQAAESTKALLMYFEVAESGKKELATEVIEACTKALKLFGSRG